MSRKERPFMILSLIFCVVGIGLLLGALFGAKSSYEFGQTAESVTGIISEIQSHRDSDGDVSHTVYVTYTFRGQEYVDVTLNTYSSSMYEGQKIELLCDPEKPSKVRSGDHLYLASVILGFMGIIFLVISGAPLVITFRKKAAKQKLLEAGYILHAQVERIEKNRNVTINGSHPYVIFCTYQDPFSGMIYRFKSDNIWTNPDAVFHQGATIDVYVNESDYSQYYVAATEALQKRIVDYT